MFVLFFCMKSVFQIELTRYFLLARPYSWVSVAFSIFLADIFVNKSLSFDNVLLGFSFTISLWISLNLFAEKVSKDMSVRGKINFLVPISFLILSLIILYFLGNFISFLGFIIILIAFFFYSLKNNSKFLGPFSFLFRGLMEVGLFFIGLSFFRFDFVGFDWILLGIIIYLITCARNLVGDLRDLEFDKFTFPKIVNVKFSKLIIFLFYLIPLFFYKELIFSIFIVLLLIIFNKNFYLLHRLLLLFNVLICINLSVLLGVFNSNLIWLLIISILLNLMYNFVPRKSNPWKNFFLSKFL